MLPASYMRCILTVGKSTCVTNHLRSLKLLPKTRTLSTLGSSPATKTTFGSVLPFTSSKVGALIDLPKARAFSTQSEQPQPQNEQQQPQQQQQPQTVEAKPPKEYIQMLKEMADMQPTNAMSQAIYIKELAKIDTKAVIERLKDSKFAVNEEIIREHIKALIKEGAFDKIPLAQLVARLEAANGAGALNLSGSGPSGTADHPLHVILGQHWTSKFGTILSILLTVALIYVIAFRGGGLGEFFQNKAPNQAEVAATTFNDVIGNEEAKEELGYIIDYLKSPGKYARLNVRLPKGILLVGPPGCGKTLLARAVAGEAGVPFYYASGSEFEEMLVGVGARRIRNLFQKAKETSPCIIFIDEIDAIGGKRDSFDNKAKMTLNQLLVELDGFSPSSGVVVIAATNLQESLDPALVRPGRFDRQVSVQPPDVKARREMIGHYLNNRQAPDVDVEQLAKTTHGFSGADIFNMVNSAAIQATKNQMRKITMSQLRLALEDVVMGPARKSMLISPETKKITAFHESGHAIMALNAQSEIFKATLVPRGMALGMVYFLPKDEHMTTKEDFISNIDIAMGGRVAEELIFGPNKVTQGAGGDFQQATKTAQDMVLKYGMSPKVGHISIDTQQLRYMSPETKALIESEIKTILEDSYQRTKSFLTAHRGELTSLANALLEYETLTFDEVKAVVNKQDIHAIKKLKQQEEALLHEREKQHYHMPGVVPGDLSLPEKLDDSSVVTLKHNDKEA